MPPNTATVSTQSCEAAFSSMSFKRNLKPLPTFEKVNEKEFILDNKKWKYCCHLCHEKGLNRVVIKSRWPGIFPGY